MSGVGNRGGVDPYLITRKDFVRIGGLGAAALVLGVGASEDTAFAQARFS